MRWFLALVFSCFACAQTVSNAASVSAGLAPGALASIYGNNLAPIEEVSGRAPHPLTLGRVEVQVTDSTGEARGAGLLFASPAQVNFQIPETTAPGPATVSVVGGASPVSARVEIQKVAPALFSMNGSGIAAATAVRVIFPSLDKFPVPVYRCSGLLASQCGPAPIEQEIDSTLYVSLLGTGIRDFSSLADIVVNAGGERVTPTYAGPQLDSRVERVDFPLPRSLHGEIEISVTVDGVTSNAVRMQVR